MVEGWRCERCEARTVIKDDVGMGGLGETCWGWRRGGGGGGRGI